MTPSRKRAKRKGVKPRSRPRAARRPTVSEAVSSEGEAAAVLRAPVPRVRGIGAAEAPASGGAGLFVRVDAQHRQRMILVPPRGLRATGRALDASVIVPLLSMHACVGQPAASLSHFMGMVGLPTAPALGGAAQLTVVDSLAENGAKLVEMAVSDEALVRATMPGLRIVPEVFYEPMSLRLSLQSSLQPLGGSAEVTVNVRSSADHTPLRDVHVMAFTNFALRLGAEARTDMTGRAILKFTTPPKTLERLFAFADSGHWSVVLGTVAASTSLSITMPAIDLTRPHLLRQLYGEAPLTRGAGVKVAVLDTGCGPHPDLQIAGGLNTVFGGVADDFADNGDLHGTHVAGIIAGRGAAPAGIRGIAPGATLFSYRVFGKGKNASNFDIAKAIDRAVTDGCDLLNLSLGRPQKALAAPDELMVRFSLEDAREAGVVSFAAAGNDSRSGVSFPASDSLCLAVSAMGNRSLVPKETVSAASAAGPPLGAVDPEEVIATFSNVGPEVDVTAPGIGIISTVAPAGLAVMDGTSMACPAAVGTAARLLAENSAILSMARGPQRAAAIVQLVLAAATSRGFPIEFEGHGLPL